MTGKIKQAVGLLMGFIMLMALLPSVFAADNRAGSESESSDDIVVIVSSNSTVKALTRNHIEDIFLGRVQHYPDGQRAVPIDQAEDSAVRERFNLEILARTSAQVRTLWSRILFTGRGRPPRSVGTCEEVLQAVAADVYAIGYIERRFVNDSVVVVFE